MSNNLEQRVRLTTGRLRRQLTILVAVVAAAWVLELLDTIILRQALNAFGVLPRTVVGLRGVLLMPLLHGGLAHLAANSIPFLVLGWLVMIRGYRDFLQATAIIMLITGLGLWLLGGSRVVYIGASGLVFGYFGLLLLRGYFERSATSILIAVLVALLYGGLILGVLPQRPGVSWEAHLLGFIAGVLSARLLSSPRL